MLDLEHILTPLNSAAAHLAATVPAWPLAADTPPMDAATALRVLSRAIHILCAIILGGGLFYMRGVLVGSGPDACFAGRRQAWARWVAIASTLLLASGLYNFMTIIQQSKLAGAQPLPSTYHMLFGIKFLLGIGVMFVASLIGGRSAAADRARAKMSTWLNLGWYGVMAIVILGAMLRMLHA